jgi:hypothetical protein
MESGANRRRGWQCSRPLGCSLSRYHDGPRYDTGLTECSRLSSVCSCVCHEIFISSQYSVFNVQVAHRTFPHLPRFPGKGKLINTSDLPGNLGKCGNVRWPHKRDLFFTQKIQKNHTENISVGFWVSWWYFGKNPKTVKTKRYFKFHTSDEILVPNQEYLLPKRTEYICPLKGEIPSIWFTSW